MVGGFVARCSRASLGKDAAASRRLRRLQLRALLQPGELWAVAVCVQRTAAPVVAVLLPEAFALLHLQRSEQGRPKRKKWPPALAVAACYPCTWGGATRCASTLARQEAQSLKERQKKDAKRTAQKAEGFKDFTSASTSALSTAPG